jgi:hypothetical protein
MNNNNKRAIDEFVGKAAPQAKETSKVSEIIRCDPSALLDSKKLHPRLRFVHRGGMDQLRKLCEEGLKHAGLKQAQGDVGMDEFGLPIEENIEFLNAIDKLEAQALAHRGPAHVLCDQ